MSTANIKIAFGGASVLSGPVDQMSEWLNVLTEAGVDTIDTAAAYGGSEELLGQAGAASRFTIDTKSFGGLGPERTKDVVIAQCRESLAKLQTESVSGGPRFGACCDISDNGKVDVCYLHAPERRVPIKDTLEGLTELHREGAFKRLGLSNYFPYEIEEAVRVAKEHDLVVPSVYQGNYSAVARLADKEVFPIIRKHNMAFYAYSPIAGDLLSKSKATLTEAGGRIGKDHPFSEMYNGMYNRTKFLDALDDWEHIARDEKISRAELAYRWIANHSELRTDKGDAICVGARNSEQFKESVRALRTGPLSDATVKKVNKIWDDVKDEAFLDNHELTTSKG